MSGTIKRYALFAGDTCYAKGGARDLQGFYDTQIEALTFISPLVDEDSDLFQFNWYQIYDLVEQKIVLQSEGQAIC